MLVALLVVALFMTTGCNESNTTTEENNTYYRDADGDGFGNPNDSVTTTDTTPPDGYVTDNTDFDDNDATSYPGATEQCDSVDNNGDGQIDEGVTNGYYADVDGDTYGDINNTTEACTAPVGYVLDSADCDDTDNTIYPGATDTCGDNIDQDCDGLADELCDIYVPGNYSTIQAAIDAASIGDTILVSADIAVKKNSDGSTYYSALGLSFVINRFDSIHIGQKTVPPTWGINSDIRIDNINIYTMQ